MEYGPASKELLQSVKEKKDELKMLKKEWENLVKGTPPILISLGETNIRIKGIVKGHPASSTIRNSSKDISREGEDIIIKQGIWSNLKILLERNCINFKMC